MKTAMRSLPGRIAHRFRDAQERSRRDRLRRRIEAILRRSEAPRHYDSEELFRKLQSQYTARPDYGYDPLSSWWRGVERVKWLHTAIGQQQPGLRILEAACGDGMFGHALACYGHEVVLSDIEDWRDSRAKAIPFVKGDLCGPLPLESASMDVAVSYNAFIHLEDPAAALLELVRICKPGGVVFLKFGSLFSSPWGMHAYRTLRMPYPQFLFSPSFLETKFRELGIDAWPAKLGRSNAKCIPLNGWRLRQYQQSFQESGCELQRASTQEIWDHLDLIERFPDAFTGQGLTFEDVTTYTVSVLLRKQRTSDRSDSGPADTAGRPRSSGSLVGPAV